MKENQGFLEEKLLKEGSTNLGVYYERFREEQALQQSGKSTVNMMIPPTQ